MSEFNPLVQRVDALLKRHQQQVAAADSPSEASSDRAAPVTESPEAPPYADPSVARVAHTPDTDDADADIPVLTEIVDPDLVPAAETLDQETLVARIEAAVLEKMLAELDQALEQRLGRAIGDLLEQSVHGLRVELSIRLRQMVREAVATSITKVLDERARQL